MAGWDLKAGELTALNVSEDHIWSLFNYVFSDSCRKTNTYKFGLIKSLLDNLFNGAKTDLGMFYTYEEIFSKFAENYWNLVVKYGLHQMKYNGKSSFSKVEQILIECASKNEMLSFLEFESLDEKGKKNIIKRVTTECKRFVVGALYEDFEGILYRFDLKEKGLTVNYCVYEFMLKYKLELEKLNYYSWARFLEKVNDDKALTRVIEKIELATPRRSNLSVYRDILYSEFEENTCFYCGRKLTNSNIHVDHFIPWSFVKDDKIWNFVLSCSRCNEKKNNRIPDFTLVKELDDRNNQIKDVDRPIVRVDFAYYRDGLIDSMWYYAKMGGMKVFPSKESNKHNKLVF